MPSIGDAIEVLASMSSARLLRARLHDAPQTSANDMLAKTSMASPIDGIVSRLRVREGEMVVIGISPARR